MAEGVGDLPMAVSSGCIPKRVQHLGARSYRSFPQSIYALDVKVQNEGSTTHTLWREYDHLGNLIRDPGEALREEDRRQGRLPLP
jgi:hypothetical protein